MKYISGKVVFKVVNKYLTVRLGISTQALSVNALTSWFMVRTFQPP